MSQAEAGGQPGSFRGKGALAHPHPSTPVSLSLTLQLPAHINRKGSSPHELTLWKQSGKRGEGRLPALAVHSWAQMSPLQPPADQAPDQALSKRSELAIAVSRRLPSVQKSWLPRKYPASNFKLEQAPEYAHGFGGVGLCISRWAANSSFWAASPFPQQTRASEANFPQESQRHEVQSP